MGKPSRPPHLDDPRRSGKPAQPQASGVWWEQDDDAGDYANAVETQQKAIELLPADSKDKARYADYLEELKQARQAAGRCEVGPTLGDDSGGGTP